MNRERRSRDPPGLYLGHATVGVAGLGGLGSNLCQMLARAGVGRLVVADCDRVEYSNLNRQDYLPDDVGSWKTYAASKRIRSIDPDVEIIAHCVRLEPSNVVSIFSGCDVVCEALDSAESKSMLVDALLIGCPGMKVVSGSGMAGLGDPGLIKTEKRFRNLHVCGDGISEDSEGFTAARVCVCAGHMACAVIDILRTK